MAAWTHSIIPLRGSRRPTKQMLPFRPGVQIPCDRFCGALGQMDDVHAARCEIVVSLGLAREASLALRPPDRSAARGDLCREAPTRPVTRPSRSPASGPIDNIRVEPSSTDNSRLRGALQIETSAPGTNPLGDAPHWNGHVAAALRSPKTSPSSASFQASSTRCALRASAPERSALRARQGALG